MQLQLTWLMGALSGPFGSLGKRDGSSGGAAPLLAGHGPYNLSILAGYVDHYYARGGALVAVTAP